MSIDLDALRQRLQEAVANGKSSAEVLEELGISPENMKVLQEMLGQTGFDLGNMFTSNKEDMANMISEISKNFSEDTKEQLSEMFKGMLNESGQSVPPELEQFINDWKKSK
ncbi:MAG: hypothetical protein PWP31_733 [Clostridia bacterium]|nr:hypothetical protein [Clostridia bacterium]